MSGPSRALRERRERRFSRAELSSIKKEKRKHSLFLSCLGLFGKRDCGFKATFVKYIVKSDPLVKRALNRLKQLIEQKAIEKLKQPMDDKVIVKRFGNIPEVTDDNNLIQKESEEPMQKDCEGKEDTTDVDSEWDASEESVEEDSSEETEAYSKQNALKADDKKRRTRRYKPYHY